MTTFGFPVPTTGPGAADVAHLALLAHEKEVPVVVDRSLPYQGVSLIERGSDA